MGVLNSLVLVGGGGGEGEGEDTVLFHFTILAYSFLYFFTLVHPIGLKIIMLVCSIHLVFLLLEDGHR